MLALVLQEPAALAATDRSSVRRVTIGSAPLTQALIDRIKAAFPGAPVTNGWGTTESGPVAFGPHPRGVPRPDLSLGHPVEGVDVRLVAGDDLDAEEGVLQVRTPVLMPGYLNLPEKTAQVMTTDGYYVTGDVMRRDADGFYYFVGRADDMFVCGGENIYPGEVETMLERHPGIQQACVVAVPDEIKGAKPVAFVVRAGGDGPSARGGQAVGARQRARPTSIRGTCEFVSELPLAGTEQDRPPAPDASARRRSARSGARVRAMIIRAHGEPRSPRLRRAIPRSAPGPGRGRGGRCGRRRSTITTSSPCAGCPASRSPCRPSWASTWPARSPSSAPGVEDWAVGDRVLVDPDRSRAGRAHGRDDPRRAGRALPRRRAPAHPHSRRRHASRDAAALPVAYGTAHRMMVTQGRIAAGERVLILGASGGVGTCCVFLAKMAGATVIACASSDEKIKRLYALGADHVIDYARGDFMAEVHARFGKPSRRSFEGGVDVVINFTGGDTWVPSLRCLRRGGRLLTCGATAGLRSARPTSATSGPSSCRSSAPTAGRPTISTTLAAHGRRAPAAAR